MTQTIDYPTDSGKTVNILFQQRVVDRIGMQGGIRKGNAILIEVVAHANLATEGITTRVKVNLVVLIVASLYHHGYIEVGIADGIDDTDLKAEVGQRNDDAVDFIAMLTELFRNLQSVLTGLNARTACRCSVLRQDDVLVTTLVKRLQ